MYSVPLTFLFNRRNTLIHMAPNISHVVTGLLTLVATQLTTSTLTEKLDCTPAETYQVFYTLPQSEDTTIPTGQAEFELLLGFSDSDGRDDATLKLMTSHVILCHNSVSDPFRTSITEYLTALNDASCHPEEFMSRHELEKLTLVFDCENTSHPRHDIPRSTRVARARVARNYKRRSWIGRISDTNIFIDAYFLLVFSTSAQ